MSDWRDRAACSGDLDWPFRPSTADRPYADERDAMRVCEDECPVRAQCAALAAAVRPTVGVWAGRTWRMTSTSSTYGEPLEARPRT